MSLYHALGEAALRSDQRFAETLLKFGADLNHPHMGLPHPLNLSVDKGNVDMVRFWLKAKAPLERRNNSGLTPLMSAAANGDIEICELLVNNGEFSLLQNR